MEIRNITEKDVKNKPKGLTYKGVTISFKEKGKKMDSRLPYKFPKDTWMVREVGNALGNEYDNFEDAKKTFIEWTLEESLNGYESETEELIMQLFKANKLKVKNIDIYGTDEYWLVDAIENLQDLDHIYQTYVPDSLKDKFKAVTGYEEDEELDESLKNELKDKAKKHKKTDKKGARGWFMNFWGGNVEHNISKFNSMNNSAESPSTCPMGPMGEDLDNMDNNNSDTVTLYYNKLDITVVTKAGNPTGYYDSAWGQWYPDDDETAEITIDYEYDVDKNYVEEVIADYLTEEELPGIGDMEPDDIYKFIEDNFDSLFEKYEEEILNYFEDSAREEAEENYEEPEPDYDDYYESKELKESKDNNKLLVEKPDEFGVATDDELEADYQKQLARLNQEREDRKARVQQLREKNKQIVDEFIAEVKSYISENKNSFNELATIMDKENVLTLFAPNIESTLRNAHPKLKYAYYSLRKDSFEISCSGWGTLFKYVYSTGKYTYAYSQNNLKDSLDMVLAAIKATPISAVVESVIKYNEKETAEWKQNKKTEKLFSSSDLSKITAAANVSNPGHWAYGDNYFIFKYNGKVYHFESYDSGAYTNNHVDQLKVFRQIDINDRGTYSYDSPTIKDINPTSVGLQMNRNYIVGGRIELSKLSKLSEQLKEDKKEKQLYTYNGPVYLFDTYLGDVELETKAVSFKQARQNFIFNAAAKNGYDRSKGANIKIDDKYIVLHNNVPYEDEEEIDDYIEKNHIHYCDKCGVRLNDREECPVCDLGERAEDYLEEDYNYSLLDELINRYYYEYNETTHNKIWEEIMEYYNDEALANDVLAALEDGVDLELGESLNEDIEKHNELNPKLFINNKLQPEVKEKILEIADKFIENLKEDNIELDVKDIVLLGSNASYNYTKDSDLDIHIISDTSDLDCSKTHLPIIYNAYKKLFNDKHDILINGIEVEVYVENNEQTAKSNGVYSVKTDEWIKEPSQQEIPELDREEFDSQFNEWENKYMEIVNNPTLEKIESYIDEIYMVRQKSIQENGEYSIGNLIFKELRNLGYLQNLKDLKVELEDKELSL